MQNTWLPMLRGYMHELESLLHNRSKDPSPRLQNEAHHELKSQPLWSKCGVWHELKSLLRPQREIATTAKHPKKANEGR
jgi:hypothetical protein